ncbi:hypothetical protein A0R60_3720 [Enterobacter asburiae]|nr:hypothetical protein A0R60_3720 [Enterobacter asburiae]
MWLLDQWAERHIRDAQKKVNSTISREAANPLRLTMIRTSRLNYGLDTVC